MTKYIVKSKLSLTVVIALSLLFLGSCVDMDVVPHDRLSDIAYWQKPDAAFNAVNTCYTNLMSADEVIFSDAMSDNAYCKVGKNQAIGNGSYATDDGYVMAVWDSKYAGIRNCNILLDNIDKVPGLSEELKRRYIAEAKVIRAYLYFELYTKFGDIPYFTHTITIAESQEISRTPKAEIVESILSELTDIISSNVLPEFYSDKDKGRITRYAAMGLKSRILLFEGKWAELKAETEKIMNKFSLFPNFEGLFYAENEGNAEVILDIQYMLNTREHGVQYEFLPPSLGGYSKLAPLQELVDSYIMNDGQPIEKSVLYNESTPFANRDPRLAATIIYTGNSYKMADGTNSVINCEKGSSKDGYMFSSDCTPTGYYLKKYFDKDYKLTVSTSGLNIILIRYADVLLMNAEANAELGTLNATVWNNTIKALRQRAGFTKASALDFPAGLSNGELIQVVRNERRSELAFEGQRHRDIIRWKIAENVMNGPCHGLKTNDIIGVDSKGHIIVETRIFDKSKHYLWPIPQTERDLNNNLTKNPNW